MAHWENRPEKSWQEFQFNQPYQKGLKRLKEEVLTGKDFDPATLWQWGTMQAAALIQVLKDSESTFGKEGQAVVSNAIEKIGIDVGRQILKGVVKPDEMSEMEFMSFFATIINRVVYASLEDPKIDSETQASFDILWCPHQDQYASLDCRVQRYFVQGMLKALQEKGMGEGFEVRFDTTIPSGGATCHFTLWKATPKERSEWEAYTKQLEEKALALSHHEECSEKSDRERAEKQT